MSQLLYPDAMPQGLAGSVGETGDNVILTRRVPTGYTVQSGTAVEWYGPADDLAGNLIEAIKPLGIAARDITDTDSAEIVYSEGQDYPVLSKGTIWGQADGDIDANDAVFIRYRYFTQVISVNFDIDFVTGNVINGQIGGVAIAPVTYATSHSDTMNALGIAMLNTGMTSAVSINAGTQTLLITISTTLDPALGDSLGDYLATTSFTVTLGATQPVAAITENRAPSSNKIVGGFRADDDDTGAGATAVACTQMKFLSTADANDLVLIDSNLP